MGKFGQFLILTLFSAASLTAQSNSLTSAPPKATASPEIRSSFGAILSKTLDARKAKAGDIVLARIAEDVKLKGDIQIPKYAKLIGHLADVRVKGRGSNDSRIVVVFDKAQMRDGREVPLQVTILNIAPADDATETQGDGNREKKFDIMEALDASAGTVLRSNADNLRVESGSRIVLSVIKQ